MKTAFPAFALAVAAALFAAPAAAEVPASQPAKPKFTIGRDTTYLTGPLRADGTVDYVAACDQELAKGVKPEENAYVLLFQVFSPDVPEDVLKAREARQPGYRRAIEAMEAVGVGKRLKEIRQETMRRLGLTTQPADAPYFVQLEWYFERNPKADYGFGATTQGQEGKSFSERWKPLKDQLTKNPWKAEEHPAVADWLKKSEKPLAILAEAARRPKYYGPKISADGSMISLLLPSLGNYMDAGRALACRATLAIGRGDVEAAWRDIVTIRLLGGLVGREPLLISRMVGILLDGQSIEAAYCLLEPGRLTVTQARKMLTELETLPPLHGPGDSFVRYERFLGLSEVQRVAASKDLFRELSSGPWVRPLSTTQPDSQALKAAVLSLDWDVVLRLLNRLYDRWESAVQEPTFVLRTKAWRALVAEGEKYGKDSSLDGVADRMRKAVAGPAVSPAEKVRIVSEMLGEYYVGVLTSGMEGVVIAFARTDARDALLRVGLALAAYRGEKGTYPEKLTALVPACIKNLPNDPFTDQPLKYSRTADGYLLYSVGENMADDGGKNDPNAKPPLDDIAIRVPADTNKRP